MGNLSPLKIIYLKLHFGNGRHLIVATFTIFLLVKFRNQGVGVHFDDAVEIVVIFHLSRF